MQGEVLAARGGMIEWKRLYNRQLKEHSRYYVLSLQLFWCQLPVLMSSPARDWQLLSPNPGFHRCDVDHYGQISSPTMGQGRPAWPAHTLNNLAIFRRTKQCIAHVSVKNRVNLQVNSPTFVLRRLHCWQDFVRGIPGMVQG